MYEIYEELLKLNNVTTADVCRATGISQSTMSNWKKRRNALSTKNARLVAQYFGVSVEYLMGGEDPNAIKFEKEKIIQAYHKGEQGYYLDPRAAEIAQEIAINKELGGLFDAARNASPEDLLTVQTMLEALKKKG